ncbi:hypothetical protein FGIG_10158 [Fasciola gigantica]|uniref:Uncharacterized protein n=1 Tax=Fasciola gigantica TaxID=46835 RepID=A0A504YHE9_FASGI|nr:hypothetical protein FGIG_10158 [Fasciola gigantica]
MIFHIQKSNEQSMNRDVTSCFHIQQHGIGLHLTKLNLSGNNLYYVPSDIANLTELRHLNVSRNHLRGSAFVPGASSTGGFRMSSQTGPQRSTMSTVAGVTKASNVQLPEELTKLGQLHTLIMSDCELTRIPAVVFHLTELKKLDISGNPVGQIPDEISYLRQLRCLIAKHMGLDTVPNQLTNCSRLQVLNLYGNQITTLPEELSKLQRLEQLYLDSRHFIEVVTTHQRASRPFGRALQTRTSNAFVQSLPKTLQSALTSPEPESQGTAEDVNKVNRSIIEKIKSLLKKGKMKSLHLPNVVFRLKSIRVSGLVHTVFRNVWRPRTVLITPVRSSDQLSSVVSGAFLHMRQNIFSIQISTDKN